MSRAMDWEHSVHVQVKVSIANIWNAGHRLARQFIPFKCWLHLVVFLLTEDFLSNFVLILIILNLSLWVLYYTAKLWNACFWTTLGCSFTCHERTFNLVKSSLWICHLNRIEMYIKLDRKSSFTSAAIWWSSTCILYLVCWKSPPPHCCRGGRGSSVS